MIPASNRVRATAAAFGGLAMLAMSACMPADGTTQTIAIAGSDTTQDIMETVAALDNANTEWNSDPDTVVNILSVESSPGQFVPGDAECADRTYQSPPDPGELNAPNGSSAGRDALKASVLAGDGCIDVARSSAGPRPIGTGSGQDLASFEYYAFGLDALWFSSTSNLAPSSLSFSEVVGIYNCTFTNWNQVGGGNGPIQRYWIQPGSGTRQSAQQIIGFDPTLISGPGCPAAKLTQENTGQVIAANGDQATAIEPYSVGNWVAQANGGAPDQRSGQEPFNRELGLNECRTGPATTLAYITPASPPPPGTAAGPFAMNPALVTEEGAPPPGPGTFSCAVRYIFNVIDSGSASYAAAKRFVGMDNSGDPDSVPQASPLCNGNYAAEIATKGFLPLDDTVSSANLDGFNCRKFSPV
jgi:phosphate transport system substrate-binding protein